MLQENLQSAGQEEEKKKGGGEADVYKRQVLDMARREGGVRRLPVLPLWLARAAAPLLEWYARRRGRRPLYTRYSLYTLSSNDRFSHDKATAELG